MSTSVEITTVTPEMATEWLEKYQYEHQRSIRPAHVKFLAGEMEQGAFKQDTTIELSNVNGHTYLTDGRHRLSALAWTGMAQRFVIIHRDLKDEAAVAEDYTRTDKGLRRTVADDYRTLAIELELGVTATQVNHHGSACMLILNDFRGLHQKDIHPSERLRVMREYGDALTHYLAAIEGAGAGGAGSDFSRRMMRAATLSVGLVTFRYSAKIYTFERVYDFWHGIAMDDGLRQNDPRKVANRHIGERGMAGGGVTQSKAVSAAYSSRYLAFCFNAWTENRTLLYTKVDDATKPIQINGSPYTGK